MKKQKIVQISVRDIIPNSNQPRSIFGREELDNLALSIKAHGVLQPIIVRKRSDCHVFDFNGERVTAQKYEIIAGERRWKAARIAGLEKIPCIIIGADEKSSALIAVTENLQRQDLTFFEVAFAFRRLQEAYGITQTELSKKLALSQSSVANKLRLLRFSDEEMDFIIKYNLSERHARELIRLNNEAERREALSRVVLEHLSISQTQQLVDGMLLPELPEDKPAEEKSGMKRKTIYKISDIRFFFNSIDRSLSILKKAGIECIQNKSETDEFLELKICIPKRANILK